MRSRRPEGAHRPLYVRVLRLQHVTPSGFLCFVFLEGAIALGILLALAELVSWWGVLVLPITVAVMVKLNDVIAGALSRPAPPAASFPRAQPLRPATAAGPATGPDARLANGPATFGAPMTGPAALRHSVTDAGSPSAPAVVSRATPPTRISGEATTRLPGVISREQGAPIMRPWAEEAEAHQQRVRQSARGRYE
ncbi:hypothetical protein [Paractinoplanes durhamensis]|uniref:Uncharacterized protein n=1 Tax=Paractinoplanes durhamensis TaxID=113563 RepID=A0ABQ3Z8A6_9ACTN|nr:hypothetical protein [Actinoplanes durhamensis]GIE06065.1 hypothetical protein Adu01nite_74150 [Actinoplanes durhamensis]